MQIKTFTACCGSHFTVTTERRFFGHQGATFFFVFFLCLSLAATCSPVGHLYWVGHAHVGATFLFVLHIDNSALSAGALGSFRSGRLNVCWSFRRCDLGRGLGACGAKGDGAADGRAQPTHQAGDSGQRAVGKGPRVSKKHKQHLCGARRGGANVFVHVFVGRSNVLCTFYVVFIPFFTNVLFAFTTFVSHCIWAVAKHKHDLRAPTRREDNVSFCFFFAGRAFY